MKKKDLSAQQVTLSQEDAEKISIGIVVSRWNSEVTTRLLDGCVKFLKKANVKPDQIFTVHVPGAFELPTGARILDDRHQPDAIICLGCVIKGETSHNKYINYAVSTGLVQLGVLKSKPVIYGVLTPDNMEQAMERAGGAHGNKGVEAAASALQMIMMKKELFDKKKQIGFSRS